MGTIIAIIITGGLWLLTLPLYPKRCVSCGSTYGAAKSAWKETFVSYIPEQIKDNKFVRKYQNLTPIKKILFISLGLIVLSLFFTSTRQTPPKKEPVSPEHEGQTINVEPPSPEQMEQILKGKQYLEKLNKKYPDSRPMIEGLGVSTGRLTVWMPKSEWEKISHEQREELAAYLKYLIPRARKNPAPFLNITSTAPVYDTFVRRAGHLDSWAIGVGRLIKVHGEQQAITADKIVYEGEIELNTAPP